jgi:hypothetical protein
MHWRPWTPGQKKSKQCSGDKHVRRPLALAFPQQLLCFTSCYFLEAQVQVWQQQPFVRYYHQCER